MAVQTGGRVRHRGNAEAHSKHPARNSLTLPAPTARVTQLRVPAQPLPADPGAVPRADSPANDGLSAPALAFLAAAAIFEGYRWLGLFRGSPSVPDTFAVAATATAITLSLIRPAAWTRAGLVRRAIWAGACSLVGAALLVPFIGVPVTDRIVGAVSLVLAVAALLGVASREHDRRAGRSGGSGPLH